MRKGLTAALSAQASVAPGSRRYQLIAWSLALDEHGATDCGIMRVQGRNAECTSFMFVPNGEMHTESGDVVRAEVQDFKATFISDESATIDGKTLTGSRWRVRSSDLFVFVAWNPSSEDQNQEGEVIITDESFEESEARWPATLSYWSH